MSNIEDATKYLNWMYSGEKTQEEIDEMTESLDEDRAEQFAELWSGVTGESDNIEVRKELHSIEDIILYAASWSSEREGRSVEYYQQVFTQIIEMVFTEAFEDGIVYERTGVFLGQEENDDEDHA